MERNRFDVYLLNTLYGLLDASLHVFPDDKDKVVAPDQRFTTNFLYTLGIPRLLQRPFFLEWRVGVILLGPESPRNVVFDPPMPQHTRTVDGEEVAISADEYQIGVLHATMPDQETIDRFLEMHRQPDGILTVEGKIITYQPDDILEDCRIHS